MSKYSLRQPRYVPSKALFRALEGRFVVLDQMAYLAKYGPSEPEQPGVQYFILVQKGGPLALGQGNIIETAQDAGGGFYTFNQGLQNLEVLSVSPSSPDVIRADQGWVYYDTPPASLPVVTSQPLRPALLVFKNDGDKARFTYDTVKQIWRPLTGSKQIDLGPLNGEVKALNFEDLDRLGTDLSHPIPYAIVSEIAFDLYAANPITIPAQTIVIAISSRRMLEAPDLSTQETLFATRTGFTDSRIRLNSGDYLNPLPLEIPQLRDAHQERLTVQTGDVSSRADVDALNTDAVYSTSTGRVFFATWVTEPCLYEGEALSYALPAQTLLGNYDPNAPFSVAPGQRADLFVTAAGEIYAPLVVDSFPLSKEPFTVYILAATGETAFYPEPTLGEAIYVASLTIPLEDGLGFRIDPSVQEVFAQERGSFTIASTLTQGSTLNLSGQEVKPSRPGTTWQIGTDTITDGNDFDIEDETLYWTRAVTETGELTQETAIFNLQNQVLRPGVEVLLNGSPVAAEVDTDTGQVRFTETIGERLTGQVFISDVDITPTAPLVLEPFDFILLPDGMIYQVDASGTKLTEDLYRDELAQVTVYRNPLNISLGEWAPVFFDTEAPIQIYINGVDSGKPLSYTGKKVRLPSALNTHDTVRIDYTTVAGNTRQEVISFTNTETPSLPVGTFEYTLTTPSPQKVTVGLNGQAVNSTLTGSVVRFPPLAAGDQISFVVTSGAALGGEEVVALKERPQRISYTLGKTSSTALLGKGLTVGNLLRIGQEIVTITDTSDTVTYTPLTQEYTNPAVFAQANGFTWTSPVILPLDLPQGSTLIPWALDVPIDGLLSLNGDIYQVISRDNTSTTVTQPLRVRYEQPSLSVTREATREASQVRFALDRFPQGEYGFFDFSPLDTGRQNFPARIEGGQVTLNQPLFPMEELYFWGDVLTNQEAGTYQANYLQRQNLPQDAVGQALTYQGDREAPDAWTFEIQTLESLENRAPFNMMDQGSATQAYTEGLLLEKDRIAREDLLTTQKVAGGLERYLTLSQGDQIGLLDGPFTYDVPLTGAGSEDPLTGELIPYYRNPSNPGVKPGHTELLNYPLARPQGINDLDDLIPLKKTPLVGGQYQGTFAPLGLSSSYSRFLPTNVVFKQVTAPPLSGSEYTVLDQGQILLDPAVQPLIGIQALREASLQLIIKGSALSLTTTEATFEVGLRQDAQGVISNPAGASLSSGDLERSGGALQIGDLLHCYRPSTGETLAVYLEVKAFADIISTVTLQSATFAGQPLNSIYPCTDVATLDGQSAPQSPLIAALAAPQEGDILYRVPRNVRDTLSPVSDSNPPAFYREATDYILDMSNRLLLNAKRGPGLEGDQVVPKPNTYLQGSAQTSTNAPRQIPAVLGQSLSDASLYEQPYQEFDPHHEVRLNQDSVSSLEQLLNGTDRGISFVGTRTSRTMVTTPTDISASTLRLAYVEDREATFEVSSLSPTQMSVYPLFHLQPHVVSVEAFVGSGFRQSVNRWQDDTAYNFTPWNLSAGTYFLNIAGQSYTITAWALGQITTLEALPLLSSGTPYTITFEGALTPIDRFSFTSPFNTDRLSVTSTLSYREITYPIAAISLNAIALEVFTSTTTGVNLQGQVRLQGLAGHSFTPELTISESTTGILPGQKVYLKDTAKEIAGIYTILDISGQTLTLNRSLEGIGVIAYELFSPRLPSNLTGSALEDLLALEGLLQESASALTLSKGSAFEEVVSGALGDLNASGELALNDTLLLSQLEVGDWCVLNNRVYRVLTINAGSGLLTLGLPPYRAIPFAVLVQASCDFYRDLESLTVKTQALILTEDQWIQELLTQVSLTISEATITSDFATGDIGDLLLQDTINYLEDRELWLILSQRTAITLALSPIQQLRWEKILKRITPGTGTLWKRYN